MNYGQEVVEAVIDKYGIEVDHRGEGWAHAPCPLHEDRKPSFAIHLQEGGWRCYAGCGSSPDLARLVMALDGGELKQIQIKLRNMFIDDIGIIARSLQPREKEEVEHFPEPLFYERGKMYPYLLKRGFTLDFLKEWDVGIDSQLKAIVVPIYDKGKLVGLYRRSIKGKFFFNSSGLRKDKLLFGLDRVPEDAEYVVVVEGALDALWLHQHGYNAVATLGGSISDTQAQMILKRFRKIILAFDNDEAGYRFTKQAYNKLVGKAPFVDSVTFPKGKKDVMDCSESELVQCVGRMI